VLLHLWWLLFLPFINFFFSILNASLLGFFLNFFHSRDVLTRSQYLKKDRNWTSVVYLGFFVLFFSILFLPYTIGNIFQELPLLYFCIDFFSLFLIDHCWFLFLFLRYQGWWDRDGNWIELSLIFLLRDDFTLQSF
jgi:hypothetical protein